MFYKKIFFEIEEIIFNITSPLIKTLFFLNSCKEKLTLPKIKDKIT